MVNINLLLKRMYIMGLPEDLIGLVSVWLKDRSYYTYPNPFSSRKSPTRPNDEIQACHINVNI